MLSNRVLGVSGGYGEEVLSVNEDSALLHDSEGSLGTGLLDIPEELVLNTLLPSD